MVSNDVLLHVVYYYHQLLMCKLLVRTNLCVCDGAIVLGGKSQLVESWNQSRRHHKQCLIAQTREKQWFVTKGPPYDNANTFLSQKLSSLKKQLFEKQKPVMIFQKPVAITGHGSLAKGLFGDILMLQSVPPQSAPSRPVCAQISNRRTILNERIYARAVYLSFMASPLSFDFVHECLDNK